MPYTFFPEQLPNFLLNLTLKHGYFTDVIVWVAYEIFTNTNVKGNIILSRLNSSFDY